MGFALTEQRSYNFEGQKEGIKETKLTNPYGNALTTIALTGLTVIAFNNAGSTTTLDLKNFSSANIHMTKSISSSNGLNKTKRISAEDAKHLQKTFFYSIPSTNMVIDELFINDVTTRLLSNADTKSQKVKEPISPKSDIIKVEDIKGGEVMYEKLLQTRDQFEQSGIYLGLGLATVTLSTSLFTPLNFSTVVPGALLFLSLPAFVVLRRKIRRDKNND